MARELLLLISLGYSTVRPSIERCETCMLILLGVCYTTSGIALEINQAITSARGDPTPPPIWTILSIGANTMFACWTYGSLTQTRTNLKETKQVK